MHVYRNIFNIYGTTFGRPEIIIHNYTSEMQSIGRAKHMVLMVTPWPLTIKFVQIVFIGIK